MSKGKQGYGLNSRRTDTQAFAPQRAARNGQPVAAASGAPGTRAAAVVDATAPSNPPSRLLERRR